MRVYIEKVKNRIEAHIPYMDGQGPTLAKEISGASWSKSKKIWAYPLDMDVCHSFRRIFGESLEIGTELWTWAIGAKEHEQKITDTLGLSLSEPVTLEMVEAFAPLVARAMYARGYQTVAARFGALTRNFIIADEPGLGKTLETFGALLEGGVRSGPILVVAPRTSLRATWANEIDKWLGDLATATVLSGTRRERLAEFDGFLGHWEADPSKLHFVLANAEMARWKKVSKDEEGNEIPEKIEYPELFDVPWRAVIGDEVHRYLTKANPRSKNVSQVGFGLQKLKATHMRIALSGTPMRGKLKNFWATLHWLRPDIYTSQWRWLRKYCVTEYDYFAFDNEKITDKIRPEMREALNRELTKIMLRRTKTELRKINPEWAPPDKEYFEVWVDLDSKQQKLYDRMESEAFINNIPVNGALAEGTRLKQIASCCGTLWEDAKGDKHFAPEFPSAKFDWLVDDFLVSRGITGDKKTEQGEAKVVIASQFTTFINLWHAELVKRGISAVKLTGETPDRERESLVYDFQSHGGPRVFLINTNAGGVSITLDAADDCVIMDETWVPDDQTQVEDRIHRTSRTDHYVNIYYVRANGTIEEEIMQTVELKDANQKRIMDESRGVAWAKKRMSINKK